MSNLTCDVYRGSWAGRSNEATITGQPLIKTSDFVFNTTKLTVKRVLKEENNPELQTLIKR